MPNSKLSYCGKHNKSVLEDVPFVAPETAVADLSVILLHNIDPAWPPAETDLAMDAVRQMVVALIAEGHRVIETPVTHADLAAVLAPFDPATHIIFNWCEEFPGIPRSDVQVAGLLEQLGYAYTGSPPEVLALSWDKVAVKARLAANGVPSPYGRIFETDTVEGWHRFPAIVKPAREHCSMGVDSNSVVLDEKVLRRRVSFVRKKFSQPALVEDFIDGREFHVTLWGNGQVDMLPPAEMDFSAFDDVRDRLCTFDSKFTPGSRHYEGIKLRIPACMTEEETVTLRQTATAAYQLLGCRDYARIDLRLRDNVFYVLDVNPNPDISSETSLAYAAEFAGMSYGAFVSQLIRMSGARHFGKQAPGVRP
jgi:D-alanine-D-alanine ligase